jgi:hypothetical protein
MDISEEKCGKNPPVEKLKALNFKPLFVLILGRSPKKCL